MFSIVDGALLQAAAVPRSRAHRQDHGGADADHANSTTTAHVRALKKLDPVVRGDVGGIAVDGDGAWSNGEPTRLNGRYVSADHFAVFGVQPLDRADVPAGGRSGRRAGGGDPEPRGVADAISAAIARILDRELLLDNEPHRVIGVLPPGAFDRHRARPLRRTGELLAAERLHRRRTRRQLALAESGRAVEARRIPRAGARRPAGGPRADRGHDSGVEERLERRRSSRSIVCWSATACGSRSTSRSARWSWCC